MIAPSLRYASCCYCAEFYQDEFARLCAECRHDERHALAARVAAQIRAGETRRQIDASLRAATMVTPVGQAISARLVVDNNPEHARYATGPTLIGRTG